MRRICPATTRGCHSENERGPRSSSRAANSQQRKRQGIPGREAGRTGGFGVVYRAEQASGTPRKTRLCVKVCGDVLTWHCEAYFGHLLRGESRVVGVYDSFAWAPAQGRPSALLPDYRIRGTWRSGELLSGSPAFQRSQGEDRDDRILENAKTTTRSRSGSSGLTPKNVLVVSDESIRSPTSESPRRAS